MPHSNPERDAARVIVAGFEGARLPAALEPLPLGGVILFSRNVGGVEKTAEVIRHARASEPPDAPRLIAIDQEGGRVARLKAPIVSLPPMRELARQGDAELTRRAARVLGTQLRLLGIGLDFAPVLDVDTNPDNPVIGDRSFSREVAEVIEHGLAFAAGLGDAGVLSCGKHFPGHGDTDLDSHLALPSLEHDRERLDEVELAPFRAAARAQIPTLMTAHVVFRALDASLPATLSRRVITGLLRDELGYGGVIVSDDLEMKAVADRWGVADSAVRAIDAGCDMLLVCKAEASVLAARDALAARAHSDAAFAARLSDAAERVSALARVPIASRDDLETRVIAAGVALDAKLVL